MKRLFIMIFCLAALIGCDNNEGLEVKVDNANNTNKNEYYPVKKLFTVDGISVYRFYDKGYYRYFTSNGCVFDNSEVIEKQDDDNNAAATSTTSSY